MSEGGRIVRAAGVLVAVVALVATAAACSGSSDEAGPAPVSAPEEPVRGGRLVVGTGGEVGGLNPLTSQWSGAAYQIGRAIMDPLVVMDRDGDWQPYLAEDLVPSEDFRTWTITLRPGIEFHNGEALDADALALFLDAATDSPLASQGFPEKPEIVVVDEATVTLTFTDPWSAMPTVFAEQVGYVIAPEQVRSGDTRTAIGTGPFVFDEWIPDDHLSATRNPDYWRTGLPYLDAIELRPFADPSARLNALRTGAVDVVGQNGTSQREVDELTADGFTVIDDVDNVGATVLLMNGDAPALADRDVRLAIVSAIDRQAFCDTVLDERYDVADQPYPEGSRWHTDVDYPAFDPDLARELVEAYEADHGPLELTAMVLTGNPLDPILVLQQMLGDVGIELAIEDLALPAYVQRLVAGDYETVFLGTFFGAADPDGNVPFFSSAGADPEALVKLNFARYRDEDVDEALAAQRATDDLAARQAEWATVWQAMAEDLPYAFLHHGRYDVLAEPDVFGLDAPTTPEGVAVPVVNRWTFFLTEAYLAP